MSYASREIQTTHCHCYCTDFITIRCSCRLGLGLLSQFFAVRCRDHDQRLPVTLRARNFGLFGQTGRETQHLLRLMTSSLRDGGAGRAHRRAWTAVDAPRTVLVRRRTGVVVRRAGDVRRQVVLEAVDAVQLVGGVVAEAERRLVHETAPVIGEPAAHLLHGHVTGGRHRLHLVAGRPEVDEAVDRLA